MDIEEYYSQLFGIRSPWIISHVDLKVQEQRVDIEIEYADDAGSCPERGTISPNHDSRKKRSRRHLDTMQFATYLHCEVARVRCMEHGAKTVSVSRNGKNSRFISYLKGLLFGYCKRPTASMKPVRSCWSNPLVMSSDRR